MPDRMRVYLPATTSTLRELLQAGVVGPAPLTAFAVTPGLREWYSDSEDAEELEYAALTQAARGSLRLIDADEGAARRRVVLAADVPATAVTIQDDPDVRDAGVVTLSEPVPVGQLAAVHVDDADAEPVIAQAAESVIAADLGDPGSQEHVDDAEGFELGWYATQEIGPLLELL